MHCEECGHDFLVAFSCKQRSLCPSCHQKRELQWAAWAEEELLAEVPHRQAVLSYPIRDTWAEIPTGDRPAVIGMLGSFARSFVESDEFARLYSEYREQQRPAPPEAPQSADEMQQTQVREMQESIRELEETMKSAPADQRPMFQDMLNMMKEQLRSFSDPDNPMFGSEMDAALKQQYEASLAEHRREVAEWEAEYPVDPRNMVRLRLEEFLGESAGVDYDAKLRRDENGRLLFERPDYEEKPSNWKLCFRAGRETVEAARAFAQSWLADLK